MESSYWSLRNKTEDVERALARGNNAWARMAAYELGIRLSHTTTALQLQVDNMGREGQADTDDQSIEKVLSQFGQELDRLLDFLKANQASRAAEVVQLLFKTLDALDRKLGSGASSSVCKEVKK